MLSDLQIRYELSKAKDRDRALEHERKLSDEKSKAREKIAQLTYVRDVFDVVHQATDKSK